MDATWYGSSFIVKNPLYSVVLGSHRTDLCKQVLLRSMQVVACFFPTNPTCSDRARQIVPYVVCRDYGSVYYDVVVHKTRKLACRPMAWLIHISAATTLGGTTSGGT